MDTYLKLIEARNAEEFWQIFNEEREKNREKQRKLPFAKKVEILEKMRDEQFHPSLT